jgi:hypothetical protein
MMTRRALAMATCAVALLGTGCGGGGEESASTTSSTARQATSAAPTPQHENTAGQGKGSPGQAKSKAKAPSHSGQAEIKVRVPPISSAPVAGSKAPAPGVKTVKGGDNSVQSYGTESGEAQRTAAAIALQAYLDERREGDWAAVCSSLAQMPKEQLEKFDKSPKGQGLSGCAQTMAALEGGNSQSQQRPGATIGEVLSLRGGGGVPGDPSYLIFTGPPASTLYSMPMYFEGGGWKVGLAQPSELPV